MSSLIKKEGFSYCFDSNACSSCEGKCCIGESGYIWINKEEIEALAKSLNLSLEEFRIKYLEKVGYKYSLKEVKLSEDNYACIFFDMQKKSCKIYENRPKQCRTFPFWDYFKTNVKEVYKECPGIRNI